ncbi:MAG: response regulator [Bacteroidota bacterium]
MAEVQHHKLLRRQLKKYLSEAEWTDSAAFRKFAEAVSDSYSNYDQDQKLSQQAFDLADKEYFEITHKLTEEKKMREESIETLLQTIALLEEEEGSEWTYDKNDLLTIAHYLDHQAQRRKEIETDLKQAMQDAQQASIAKSDFLSIMSHEIRSPLNVIIGMIHILRKEKQLPEQKENLEVLDITAQNLMLLINDILDYNKIESGKLELEFTPFDLRKLVSNIKRANSNYAKEKGNRLKVLIDDDLPEFLMGDSVRIGQIITNLVSNALKFTKEGTVTVTVDVLEQDESEFLIRVAVKDTGIGINEEQQKKIFQSFTQARSDTTREYGGTGLGLAIIKQLLIIMGSGIQVESTIGKGSTFFFELKLEEGKRAEDYEFDNSEERDLGNAYVLVVDDMPFNLTIVRKIVGDWNVRLDFAKNGLEAVEKIRENDYDIVLMDLQMPVMDGEEATREVRQFNKTLPIVALTASSNMSTKQLLLKAGMNAYLTKPFNPDDLYAKLYEILQISRNSLEPVG